VIPSEAIAKIDVRYDTNLLRDELHTKILDLIENHSRTDQLAWKLADDCPAMSFNPESEPIAKKLLESIRKIESRSVSYVPASGSSDSNFLYRPGIPMIDGLGPVGSGLHTENETLEVSTLESRASAIFEVIQHS
jgi:glutamate carboxypeptidase